MSDSQLERAFEVKLRIRFKHRTQITASSMDLAWTHATDELCEAVEEIRTQEAIFKLVNDADFEILEAKEL